jgi:hypothetical protein
MQEARKVELRFGLRRKMSVELMNAELKVCQFGTLVATTSVFGNILALFWHELRNCFKRKSVQSVVGRRNSRIFVFCFRQN